MIANLIYIPFLLFLSWSSTLNEISFHWMQRKWTIRNEHRRWSSIRVIQMVDIFTDWKGVKCVNTWSISFTSWKTFPKSIWWTLSWKILPFSRWSQIEKHRKHFYVSLSSSRSPFQITEHNTMSTDLPNRHPTMKIIENKAMIKPPQIYFHAISIL